jgi:hypothetical protein
LQVPCEQPEVLQFRVNNCFSVKHRILLCGRQIFSQP